jgi:amino acid transporter
MRAQSTGIVGFNRSITTIPPMAKRKLLKRVLIGSPISSADEGHQRLRKLIALPVFASDAISSTAYATDEMLVVLLGQAGIGALAFTKLVPIAVVVAVLLVIVTMSYRQTIFAYPSGGGSYIVSKENLGTIPSLVAGSSLLVDYILTVAVSVAGGVLAIRSAVGWHGSTTTILVCLGCVLVMTLMNLRGVKESGAFFAGPTYFYVLMLFLLIGTGLYRVLFRHLGPIPVDILGPEGKDLREGAKSLSIYMLLRAFSSGAVALSGVEAISNGVPAFKKPESKNAAKTLVVMATLLGTGFLGISILASRLKPFRGSEESTGIALMAQHVFGGRNVLFWMMQIATFTILILAANTAYADFPRLSSIIARDRFLPRQFANRGDRLVYSNGVIFLAIVASILIIVFKGDISKLIPLYAFGVFTGFTLSQTGMVKHHLKHKEPNWKAGMIINAVGAFATGLIALIVVASKFTEGAWIPAALIPLMVWGFRAIGRHYERCATVVHAEPGYRATRETHTMVVLVGNINKGVLHGIQYAQSLRPDRIMAVSVVSDDEERKHIEQQWADFNVSLDLHVLYSPYRALSEPVMNFIEELDELYRDDIITVVIPEFVTAWSTQWLHNGSAFALKARLLHRPHTAVVSVPMHVDDSGPLEFLDMPAGVRRDTGG